MLFLQPRFPKLTKRPTLDLGLRTREDRVNMRSLIFKLKKGGHPPFFSS